MEDAARVADKILELFAEPFMVADHELHMTASIGISMFPKDGDTAEMLIKHADAAMYAAKAAGKDRYAFAGG